MKMSTIREREYHNFPCTHHPAGWLLLSRTSLGGGQDESREQNPAKYEIVNDRCISELVRRGHAVEIQDVCSS